MLGYLRRDVDVAVFRRRVEPLDCVLRLDRLVRGAIGERIARTPFVDLLPPAGERLFVRLARLRTPDADHVFQHMRAIADDREIDLDILVDRGRIDVDVNLARSRRERVEPPGNAVIEARADAEHYVTVVHRPV